MRCRILKSLCRGNPRGVVGEIHIGQQIQSVFYVSPFGGILITHQQHRRGGKEQI